MKIMKMIYFVKTGVINLLVVIVVLPCSLPAPCTYRQEVGSGDIDSANVNSPDPQDTNVTILMANNMGTIRCCGIIVAWEMYMEGVGSVTVQAWRRLVEENNKYMLLGQNSVRHRSMGIGKEGRSIPNRNAIHVHPGDIIGFVQKEISTLRYTTCDPSSPINPDICWDDLLVNTNAFRTSVGDTAEFVLQQSTHFDNSAVRGYALKAYLNKKSSVSCTDRHKTISDIMDVDEHVLTLNVENIDIHDPDSTITIVSNNQSLPVRVDRNTGEITVSGNLSPEYPSTLYILKVEVYDSCSNSSSTCLVNIIVNNDPKPITFYSLPRSIEISTLEHGHVQDFTISRQRDVDDVNCYIDSTFPEHATFDIRNRTKTEYSVFVTQVFQLSGMSQTSPIVLIISCENTEGQYNQTTLTLTYDADKRRFGTLMVIVGIMLTLIILAVVTVLLSWLCHKGKVKAWPGDEKDKNEVTKSQKTAHKQPERDSGRNELWDNFNSFYKVDRGITDKELPIYVRLQNGGLAKQFYKGNKSKLISNLQQLNYNQEIGRFYIPEESYPKQFFRKRPWKP